MDPGILIHILDNWHEISWLFSDYRIRYSNNYHLHVILQPQKTATHHQRPNRHLHPLAVAPPSAGPPTTGHYHHQPPSKRARWRLSLHFSFFCMIYMKCGERERSTQERKKWIHRVGPFLSFWLLLYALLF